jgi:hypothetical protein
MLAPVTVPSVAFVDNLYQDLAAERNRVAAEVKRLKSDLAEKNRELLRLEAAVAALKPVKRR